MKKIQNTSSILVVTLFFLMPELYAQSAPKIGMEIFENSNGLENSKRLTEVISQAKKEGNNKIFEDSELVEKVCEIPGLVEKICKVPGLVEKIFENTELANEFFDDPDWAMEVCEDLELVKEIFNNPELANEIFDDPDLTDEVFEDLEFAKKIFEDPKLAKSIVQAKKEGNSKIFEDPEVAKAIAQAKREGNNKYLPKIEHDNSLEYEELMEAISRVQRSHEDLWPGKSGNCTQYIDSNKQLAKAINTYLQYEKTDEEQLEDRYKCLFEICRISNILAHEYGNNSSVHYDDLFRLAAGKFNYLAYLLVNCGKYDTVNLWNKEVTDDIYGNGVKTCLDIGKAAVNIKPYDTFLFQLMDPYHSIDDEDNNQDYASWRLYRSSDSESRLSFIMWLEGQKKRFSSMLTGPIMEMPMEDIVHFSPTTTPPNAETQYDFVITPGLQIRLTPAKGGCRHMGLSDGRQMLFAGEISFKEGEVYQITNGSGHFQPTYVQLEDVKRVFINQHIISNNSTFCESDSVSYDCVTNSLKDTARYDALVKDYFSINRVKNLHNDPSRYHLDEDQKSLVGEIVKLEEQPYEALKKTINLMENLYASGKYFAIVPLCKMFFNAGGFATKLFYKLSKSDKQKVTAFCILGLHKRWIANPKRLLADNKAQMIALQNLLLDGIYRIATNGPYAREFAEMFDTKNICKFIYLQQQNSNKLTPKDLGYVKDIGENAISENIALQRISYIISNLQKAKHFGTIRLFFSVFLDPATGKLNAKFEQLDKRGKLNVISGLLDSLYSLSFASRNFANIANKKMKNIYSVFCACKDLSESEEGFFIHQQIKNYSNPELSLLPSDIVYRTELQKQLIFLKQNAALYSNISVADRDLIVNILLNNNVDAENSNNIYTLLSNLNRNVPVNYVILRKLTAALFDENNQESPYFQLMTPEQKINIMEIVLNSFCDATQSEGELAKNKEKAKKLYEAFTSNYMGKCDRAAMSKLSKLAVEKRLISRIKGFTKAIETLFKSPKTKP